MNKDLIISQIKGVLKANDIDYTDKGIDSLYEEWLKKKGALIKLLSKSEHWNEDACAIIASVDFKKRADTSKAEGYFNNILSDIYAVNKDVALRINAGVFRDRDIFINISKEIADNLNDIFGMKIGVGTKPSRALRDILVKYDVPNLITGFDKKYQVLADALSSTGTNRDVYISVHPCDYLNMSYGGSVSERDNWTSCHNIRSGAHMNGTMSYMLDTHSFIIFALTGSVAPDKACTVRKMNRQVYAYGNGILLQSRLYPGYDESIVTSIFLDLAKKEIAACYEIDPIWERKGSVMDWVHTNTGSLHYRDYEHGSFNASVHMLNKVYDRSKPVLQIGAEAMCPCCSGKMTWTSPMICRKCDVRHTCASCGRYNHFDNGLMELNGKYYCGNCVVQCSDCNKVIGKSNDNLRVFDGQKRYVCDECYKTYTKCSMCKSAYTLQKMYTLKNGDVMCKACVGDHTVCGKCAVTVKFNDIHIKRGRVYCSKCDGEIKDET